MSLLMDALKQAEQNKTKGESSAIPASDAPAREMPDSRAYETAARGPRESANPLSCDKERPSPKVERERGEGRMPLLAPPGAAGADEMETPLPDELDFSEIEAAIAAENSPADPDPPAEASAAFAGEKISHSSDPPDGTSKPSGIEPFVTATPDEVTAVEEGGLSLATEGSSDKQFPRELPADGQETISSATADDAARILSAGSRRKDRARKRQFILAVILLVVILVLIVAYYFWSRALHVQPPAQPANSALLAPMDTPPQQGQDGQAGKPEQPQVAISSTQVSIEAAARPGAPAATSRPKTVAPEPRQKLQTGSPAGEKTARQQEAREKPVEKKPAGVSIQRHADSPSIYQMLTMAYEAYQENRILDARHQYEKVLNRQPRNRDALLGLASVAVSQGRRDEARALYRRQLEADPKDGVAQTGLLSLLSTGDPVANESLIKQMLREHGETAYLRFALGNVYAAQSRWEEARRSYFRAYSAAPRNANYLFNLAVSLDHLHQDRMALQYYRWALDQARGQAVRFDLEGARQRIRALSSSVTEGAS